jgi:hypothetical protein
MMRAIFLVLFVLSANTAFAQALAEYATQNGGIAGILEGEAQADCDATIEECSGMSAAGAYGQAIGSIGSGPGISDELLGHGPQASASVEEAVEEAEEVEEDVSNE